MAVKTKLVKVTWRNKKIDLTDLACPDKCLISDFYTKRFKSYWVLVGDYVSLWARRDCTSNPFVDLTLKIYNSRKEEIGINHVKYFKLAKERNRDVTLILEVPIIDKEGPATKKMESIII